MSVGNVFTDRLPWIDKIVLSVMLWVIVCKSSEWMYQGITIVWYLVDKTCIVN